jgi:dephospho-CoA kinase
MTGSIGMGKTETGRMFVRLGIPVFDADKSVHELYARGGKAVAPVNDAFPGVLVDGAIDRARLGEQVIGNTEALQRLEDIVHPLVQEQRQAFMAEAVAAGADIVVLDIPLLFETGGEDKVDRILVVSAPEDVQRERVLAREGMTEAKFNAILEKQLNDAEKRRRADYVIETDKGLPDAERQVRSLVDRLRAETDGV